MGKRHASQYANFGWLLRSLANSICFRLSNLGGSNMIHPLTTPVLLKLEMIAGKVSGKAIAT